MLEYRVSAADETYLFNRQNVFETFEEQYAREIIGRIVYEFCPVDEQVDLCVVEDGDFVVSGTNNPTVTYDSTDRLYGNSSAVLSQDTGV